MRAALQAASLLVSLLTVLPALAGSSPRSERSYPFGDRLVTLDVDARRVAVLLRPVADEFGAALRLTANEPRLEIALETDAQRFEHLWFLRLREDAAPETLYSLLAGLAASPDVEFATPVYRYDQAIQIPRPELLIAFADDDSQRAFEEAHPWRRIGSYPGLATTWRYHVGDRSPHELLTLSQGLARLPGVLRAEPDFICHLPTHAVPNDPRFANQWALDNTGQTGGTPGADLGATGAWDVSTGSSSVVVAILDEGVDDTHPDLAANVIGGHDSTDQAPPGGVPGRPNSDDGHGTCCAGIVAAVGNNGIGGSGICWNASVMPVRIGYGSVWTTVGWQVDAFTWATDNGADVISCSWGGGSPSGSQLDAIVYAQTVGRSGLGCVVFFSAGNNNSAVAYPAAYPETIAVGASSPCDERKSPSSCDGENWWGSNYGALLDFMAPGVLIDTTDITGPGGYTSDDYTTNFNGTSAACPFAAGTAALLLSASAGLTADEVRTYMRGSAADQVGPPGQDTPGFDETMGWGRLDLVSLMELAGAPAPPENLLCATIGGDVSLTWTNPQSYDSIIVQRDGADIASLAGSATSYLDPAVPSGLHGYDVRGEIAGSSSLGASCQVAVLIGVTDLIWKPSDVGGSVDGAAGLENALQQNGLSPFVTSSLAAVGDLDAFERIWVNLGVFPDNHVLTGGDADLLVDYLTDGIGGNRLYLEGGDAWAFDPSTSVHPLFAIDGLDDGTGNFSDANGLNTPVCDLSGLDLAYSGEAAYIDRLGALAGASVLQENSSPSYGVAVIHDAGGYRTLGASYEFAGLDDGADTKSELMAAYLGCFGGLVLVDAVTALGCGASGNDVMLGWSNPQSYDTIEVRWDGALIATLSGSATSHTDVAAPGGAHFYGVTGIAASVAAAETVCAANVTPDAITGLTCDATPTTAELTWSNGEPYGQVEVRRDGSLIATLAGTAVAYSDPGPLSGSHGYSVTGVIDGLATIAASCTVAYVAPPDLLAAPSPIDACAGDPALLSVTATGDDLQYQWQKDGVDLGGEVGSSLSLTDLTPADSGFYEVEVSNAAGSFQVGAPVFVSSPAVVLADPQDQAAAPGGSVSFTVTFDSVLPILVQWYHDGVAIAGATGSGLLLPAVDLTSSGDYWAVATNDCGSTASATASLSVNSVFIRGDGNVDGSVNLADAVFTLNVVFGLGLAPTCEDALDSNDDGGVDLSDAVYLIDYFFVGGPTPSAPFGTAGMDPTGDPLGCDSGTP